MDVVSSSTVTIQGNVEKKRPPQPRDEPFNDEKTYLSQVMSRMERKNRVKSEHFDRQMQAATAAAVAAAARPAAAAAAPDQAAAAPVPNHLEVNEDDDVARVMHNAFMLPVLDAIVDSSELPQVVIDDEDL